MSETLNQRVTQPDPAAIAYRQGRQTGLAIGALAMSVLAFISLLGLEKAILAAVLGMVSLCGLSAGTQGRRYGLAAIVIAAVYTVTFVVCIIVFHDKIGQLFGLLQQLG